MSVSELFRIAFIEKELGVKISYVSVGPDRSQTIKL